MAGKPPAGLSSLEFLTSNVPEAEAKTAIVELEKLIRKKTPINTAVCTVLFKRETTYGAETCFRAWLYLLYDSEYNTQKTKTDGFKEVFYKVVEMIDKHIHPSSIDATITRTFNHGALGLIEFSRCDRRECTSRACAAWKDYLDRMKAERTETLKTVFVIPKLEPSYESIALISAPVEIGPKACMECQSCSRKPELKTASKKGNTDKGKGKRPAPQEARRPFPFASSSSSSSAMPPSTSKQLRVLETENAIDITVTVKGSIDSFASEALRGVYAQHIHERHGAYDDFSKSAKGFWKSRSLVLTDYEIYDKDKLEHRAREAVKKALTAV